MKLTFRVAQFIKDHDLPTRYEPSDEGTQEWPSAPRVGDWIETFSDIDGRVTRLVWTAPDAATFYGHLPQARHALGVARGWTVPTATDEDVALLIKRIDAAREIVDEQAEDDGLWFVARTMPEAYLQQELRRLHAAIEENDR